jgi:hypothetical protein
LDQAEHLKIIPWNTFLSLAEPVVVTTMAAEAVAEATGLLCKEKIQAKQVQHYQ